MSDYKEVLFKWAEKYLDEDAIVQDVQVINHAGYWYSELTNQPAYDEINIVYSKPSRPGKLLSCRLDIDELPIFGELLKQLFAIAEAEDGLNKSNAT